MRISACNTEYCREKKEIDFNVETILKGNIIMHLLLFGKLKEASFLYSPHTL